MHSICAPQIKAARALLDWSQEDLAVKAQLSLNTIRKLEMGCVAPRSDTARTIRQAMENAGIEFLDHEGVRRKFEDLKDFRGAQACERFYCDLLRTAIESNGEILASVESETFFMRCCGMAENYSKRLEQMNAVASVKCLTGVTPKFLSGVLECRVIPKQLRGPLNYFVYGDQHAFALRDNGNDIRFIIFKSIHLAMQYRQQFLDQWESAALIQ
jgi:DNA-binding XRE family transcriptional regulator